MTLSLTAPPDGRAGALTAPRISVVIPARNEAARIGRALSRIFALVRSPVRGHRRRRRRRRPDLAGGPGAGRRRAEAAVPGRRVRAGAGERDQVRDRPGQSRRRRRDHGRQQRRCTADRASSPRWWSDGAAVAAASRYCQGGSQIGGPIGKSLLSRLAGPVAAAAGAGWHQRRHQLVQGVLDRLRQGGRDRLAPGLHDRHRADRQGAAAAPGSGRDPHHLARPPGGRVRVPRCLAWMPAYLRWYLFCFGGRLTPVSSRPAAPVARGPSPVLSRPAATRRRSCPGRRGRASGPPGMSSRRGKGWPARSRPEERRRHGGTGRHRERPGHGERRDGPGTRHRRGRVHRRLRRRRAAEPRLPGRRARRPVQVRRAAAGQRWPSRVPVRPRRRPRRRRWSPSCSPAASTSSRPRPWSAASATSMPIRTTCWPLTSGSPPRPATRPSPPTAGARCARSPSCPRRWSTRTPTRFPTREGQQLQIPPPATAYGFGKLAVEYFARAAWQQYGLPFTIVRPFNCVGVGETRSVRDGRAGPGEVRLASSHVVPDLVCRALTGQDPLHLLGSGEQVRHYTYGGDLARGIVTAMEHPAATARTSICRPPAAPR